MSHDIASLPDDPVKLKEKIMRQQKMLQQVKEENARLTSLNKQLNLELFARKSEKFKKNITEIHPNLYDEAEADGALSLDNDNAEENTEDSDSVVIKCHKRKKRGRKPIPDNLPRVERIIDIPDEDKTCACGSSRIQIGADTSEKLDYIPAKVQVIKTIRPKYACPQCEGADDENKPGVIQEPMPESLTPKGLFSDRLNAYILTSKFVDALPFYRQCAMLKRFGVHVDRTTMCNQALRIGRGFTPLVELMRKDILAGPMIGVDETRLQVLREKNKSPTSQSYMWLFRGGPPDQPILIYHYEPTRSGKVVEEFIGDFKGYIQCDGYSAYNFLEENGDVQLLGCMAHARRKFATAVKVTGGTPELSKALDYFGHLYKIEAAIKRLSNDEKYLERLKRAWPILNDFKDWLDITETKTLPKSPLGRAVSYTQKQWPKLMRYLSAGYLRPDNNLVENAIRPFVVGRKNWLFSGSPHGATASCNIYSLIQTGLLYNLDPFRYTWMLLEKLPVAQAEEELRALLPYNVNPETLPSYGQSVG